MNEFTLMHPWDFKLNEAPLFRKTATLAKKNVVFAKGGEDVETCQSDGAGNAFVETKNTANLGDAIVTRGGNDCYITRAANFPKLWEIDPNNVDQYRSTNFGHAIQVAVDFKIKAPWGEEQQIKAGGIIFKSFTGDVYGNQKHTFEDDFSREAKDGSLMPLTASLVEQAVWATEKGENAHLADIEARMAFEARATFAARGAYVPALKK